MKERAARRVHKELNCKLGWAGMDKVPRAGRAEYAQKGGDSGLGVEQWVQTGLAELWVLPAAGAGGMASIDGAISSVILPGEPVSSSWTQI